MRNFLLSLLAVCLAATTACKSNRHQTNPAAAFEMADSDFSMPSGSLVPLSENTTYRLKRGSNIDIHLNLRLRAGHQNPCPEGRESQCSVLLRVIKKQHRKEIIIHSEGVSHFFEEKPNLILLSEIPVETSVSKVIFRILITQGGVEHFRLDIPIKVR